MGMNLINQGEDIKGQPSGLLAQLAEFSHGKREALGLSPGRATIFLPLWQLVYACDSWFMAWVLIETQIQNGCNQDSCQFDENENLIADNLFADILSF